MHILKITCLFTRYNHPIILSALKQLQYFIHFCARIGLSLLKVHPVRRQTLFCAIKRVKSQKSWLLQTRSVNNNKLQWRQCYVCLRQNFNISLSRSNLIFYLSVPVLIICFYFIRFCKFYFNTTVTVFQDISKLMTFGNFLLILI